jgi:NAD(P)-dependent dehydrogenase (short-subunit alcohol dehydrogenase family)
MDASRVVMITGAAGNLGAACTRAFRLAGATLILVERSTDSLPRAFPDLASSGACMFAGGTDLLSQDSLAGVVDSAIRRFGRLDSLVHTVGAFRGGTALSESTWEDWEALSAANIRTTFNACRAVLPPMLAQGRGAIVTVASRHALSAPAGEAFYSASKAAVVRLTESLSLEVREQGINANVVLPGTLDTPANKGASPGADASRWVDPNSVAEIIVFLSSSAARDIHGAAIPVYGRGN